MDRICDNGESSTSARRAAKTRIETRRYTSIVFGFPICHCARCFVVCSFSELESGWGTREDLQDASWALLLQGASCTKGFFSGFVFFSILFCSCMRYHGASNLKEGGKKEEKWAKSGEKYGDGTNGCCLWSEAVIVFQGVQPERHDV